MRIRAIARGSAVVMDGDGAPDGESGAHPGEEMMTAFYLDGGRLMLTHYCVARNYPRLVATAASDAAARSSSASWTARTSRRATSATWTRW